MLTPRLTTLAASLVLLGGGAGCSSADSLDSSAKVGALFAMTGEAAFYGESMNLGAKLGMKPREAGSIELKVEDHRGDANTALSAFRKLTSVEGDSVVLTSFTGPTVAVQPLAARQKVLLLNGGGVGEDLIGQDNLYNSRLLASQIMPSFLDYELKETGAKKVATLFWNDTAGKGVSDLAKKACADADCKVVIEEPHAVGATDYRVQLARIKAASPDILVLGSYGNDVGYIVKQAREIGIDVPIVGNEYTPDMIDVGGASMNGYRAAADIFTPVKGDAESDELVSLFEKSGEKGVPSLYTANYFDFTAYVLPTLIAMAADDGQDPAKSGVLLEQMKKAVAAGTEFDTVYGSAMVFNEDGTVSKPGVVVEVRDGEAASIATIDADGSIKLNNAG